MSNNYDDNDGYGDGDDDDDDDGVATLLDLADAIGGEWWWLWYVCSDWLWWHNTRRVQALRVVCDAMIAM